MTTLPDVATTSRPDTALEAYELLGVLPGASPDLAMAMYWRRVADLRAREAAGDPEVVADLERLNEALSAILRGDTPCASTRAGAPTEPADEAGTPEARPSHALRRRWATAGGAAGLLLAAGCAATVAVPPALGIVPVAVALLIFGLAGRSTRPSPAETPFAILQLAPGAAPDDIDLAYRTLVSRWLGRLTVDPEAAIHMLDTLERAYPAAIEAAFRGSAAAATALGPAHDTPPTEAHGARRASGAGDLDVAGETGEADEAADAVGETIHDAPAGVHTERDIQRRLQATFRAVGAEVPQTTERPAVRFAVVIEAAAGNRRIPVDGRPITVGAGGDFDIAVAGTPGEAPCSYARLWVSGQELVLHASAAATCRVNEVASSWARLEHGDSVEIAGLTLRIVANERPTAEA